MRVHLLAAAAALLIAAPAFAQSVALKGADGQSATLSAADLAGMNRVKVAFDAHGEKHEYEGALLSDVLARVGAPFGEKLRGPALSNVVLVTASDGYQVAIGLTEADPATRPNRIILADRADGKALSDKDGPFKLVVEGDLRPARGVRMVTEIAVIPLAAAKGAAPAHKH
jgi:hypothetical protein